MINLEKELKQLAKDFNFTDKEVIKWWRDCVRGMWGNSIFKQKYIKENSMLIDNTNPRSMKRFPQVRKFKCAICGEMFGSGAIEIDHINSENTLTDYKHAEDFLKTILFTSPYKLQVLCKDEKKKLNGKNEVVRFGCHSIKTYAERYGMTFEQAKLEKEIINICKSNDKTLDKLYELGIEYPPTTLKGRKEMVAKLMREGLNEELENDS